MCQDDERPQWFEGKDPKYCNAVSIFVDMFRDYADLDHDVDSISPEQYDDEAHKTIVERDAVAKFIRALYQKEAVEFDIDALAALNNELDIAQQDDKNQYGEATP